MDISHISQPNLTRVGYDQFRPTLPSAFHLHGDDGMSLGGVGTDDKHHFRITNLVDGIGHRTRTKHCHQTGDGRSMSGGRTLVNVVGSECRSGKFLHQVVLFSRTA